MPKIGDCVRAGQVTWTVTGVWAGRVLVEVEYPGDSYGTVVDVATWTNLVTA